MVFTRIKELEKRQAELEKALDVTTKQLLQACKDIDALREARELEDNDKSTPKNPKDQIADYQDSMR